MADRSIITFQREDDLIAIDVENVRRVIRRPAIRPLAGAPDFVVGVARIDGRLEVLLDPHSLLAGGPAPVVDTFPRVVLVSAAGHPIGLIADSVEDVVAVPADAVIPPPPFVGGHRPEAVEGILQRGDREIVLIDPGRLLRTAELELLAPVVRSAD